MADDIINPPIENINGRVCNKCGIWKERCEFHYQKSVKSKMRSSCKNCVSIFMKESSLIDKNKFKRILKNAKRRCEVDYKRFNRSMLLTIDDIEFLWKRDNADKLDRPSLDRIDNSKGYTLDNCQFIELSENCRKDKGAKRVIQKDMDGNVIFVYSSMREAARVNNMNCGNMSTAIKSGKNKFHGFIWEIIDE